MNLDDVLAGDDVGAEYAAELADLLRVRLTAPGGLRGRFPDPGWDRRLGGPSATPGKLADRYPGSDEDQRVRHLFPAEGTSVTPQSESFGRVGTYAGLDLRNQRRNLTPRRRSAGYSLQWSGGYDVASVDVTKWGTPAEADQTSIPVVFHHRPTRYVRVRPDRLDEWKRYFLENVGLDPDSDMSFDLAGRSASMSDSRHGWDDADFV